MINACGDPTSLITYSFNKLWNVATLLIKIYLYYYYLYQEKNLPIIQAPSVVCIATPPRVKIVSNPRVYTDDDATAVAINTSPPISAFYLAHNNHYDCLQ